MAGKFGELEARMSLEAIARSDARYAELKADMALEELRDALRLESLFTEAGVDYGVEADEYRGGVIFRSVRAGAFFYVLPHAVDAAHDVMLRHGFKPYVESPAGLPEA